MNSSGQDPHRLTYGSVVSELVQFMEESFLYNSAVPVFKLSELVKLVAHHMTSLGVTSDVRSIDRTRLKDLLRNDV